MPEGRCRISKITMANHLGFTYVTVLIFIAVTGIALAGISKYWSSVLKREREKELLYRGGQIRKAIESYFNSTSGSSHRYPKSLNDLIKDPRFPDIRRHLRKLYRDPMTICLKNKGKWGLIHDVNNNIKGVYSISNETPQKRGNFSTEYENFEKAKKYSDWKFVYSPKQGTRTK